MFDLMIALYLLFVENKYYFEIQNVGETRLSGGPDNAKISRKYTYKMNQIIIHSI